MAMIECNISLSYFSLCLLALHQAGRHMEDSVIAAYSALLLGILSKHNQVLPNALGLMHSNIIIMFFGFLGHTELCQE